MAEVGKVGVVAPGMAPAPAMVPGPVMVREVDPGPVVEAMEEAEVVEVVAAPAVGVETEAGRGMDPVAGLDTVREEVPTAEGMEGVAAAEAAEVRALGQARVRDMVLVTGVVADTVNLKSYTYVCMKPFPYLWCFCAPFPFLCRFLFSLSGMCL